MAQDTIDKAIETYKLKPLGECRTKDEKLYGAEGWSPILFIGLSQKYGLSKGWIKKHESGCFKNPITRSCSTCANRASIKVDLPEWGQGYYKEVPYCLEAISFKAVKFTNDKPEEVIKLQTNCAKWAERPEEEEELAIYQRTKEVAIINEVILSVIDNEFPF